MKLRCAIIRKYGNSWAVKLNGDNGFYWFADWNVALMFANRMVR